MVSVSVINNYLCLTISTKYWNLIIINSQTCFWKLQKFHEFPREKLNFHDKLPSGQTPASKQKKTRKKRKTFPSMQTLFPNFPLEKLWVTRKVDVKNTPDVAPNCIKECKLTSRIFTSFLRKSNRIILSFRNFDRHIYNKVHETPQSGWYIQGVRVKLSSLREYRKQINILTT